MLSKSDAERKSHCFASTWWPLRRDEEGRPAGFVKLTPNEMYDFARTGELRLGRIGLY